MPSGLIALLDDVAAITKLAAASLDDIGAAVGKAGSKAAGVVIDDTAVTPRFVSGLTPDRELPIIFKIAVGSLRNKLLVILPIAMLLSAFAPWAITPLLMIGGAYLCYEGSEKILEKLAGHHHDTPLVEDADPGELEKRQVAGAIRTDFILSAEIMVIALSTLTGMSLPMQAGALALVGVAITLLVYGVVGVIVKLDDIGLHLCGRSSGLARSVGRGLVLGVPKLLAALGAIGTAAMLWVGGQILLHGMDELGADGLPHLVHDVAAGGARAVGVAVGAVEFSINALAGAIVGLLVGGVILGLKHVVPWPGNKVTTDPDWAH
jgi:uncharacterized protein